MKVSLIKAPYLSIYEGINDVAPNSAPLGLAYMTAVLREAGHEGLLWDPENQDMTYEDVRRRLSEERPRIVGISCATAGFQNALRIARIAKEVGGSIVVLGGIHASSLPVETLEQYPEIDITVYGEGENTMMELVTAYEESGSPNLSKIRGIAYRECDGIIGKNPPRPFIHDLDVLPLPARDLLPMEKYNIPKHLAIGGRSATMITSRGCPHECIFCGMQLTLGRPYRSHSAERVAMEMETLVRDYGVKYIAFWDDTFTINRKRVVEVCNTLIERKIKVKWFALCRVDNVDLELLKLMKKAGCAAVSYGCESGDPEILKAIKKKQTVEEIRAAIKATKQAGIKCLASFMFGNPGETKETIERTIDFAVELSPDIAFFFVLTPFPGTEVYNRYQGLLFDVSPNWEDYKYVLTGGNLALKSEAFTREELIAYVHTAWRRFYLRPGYIWQQITRLRSFGEASMMLRGGLGLVRQTVLTWGAKKPQKLAGIGLPGQDVVDCNLTSSV